MGKIELKIEIDADLLAEARAAGLSIVEITEAAVRARLPAKSDEDKARRWAEDNVEAIRANRERIAEHGIFGEDLRSW